MKHVATDRGGHCRLVAAGGHGGLGSGPDHALTDAPDALPERVPPGGAAPTRSLDEALEQLVGDYRESRLEQIAYPDTLSARGWRMCLRYAICVIGGVRGMELVKAMDEAYPLREECGEDHMAGQPL